MTTVASFLDEVAPFAKGGTDLLRNGEIFSLYPHPLKPDGMAALLKLLQFLFVTLPTFLRENHGLLLRREFVVNVTGHTMNAFFRMFGFDP